MTYWNNPIKTYKATDPYNSDGDPIVLPEILTKDILLDYLNELT